MFPYFCRRRRCHVGTKRPVPSFPGGSFTGFGDVSVAGGGRLGQALRRLFRRRVWDSLLRGGHRGAVRGRLCYFLKSCLFVSCTRVGGWVWVCACVMVGSKGVCGARNQFKLLMRSPWLDRIACTRACVGADTWSYRDRSADGGMGSRILTPRKIQDWLFV